MMGPPHKKSYSEEALQKALQEVKKGMSYKAASKKFGIPRSTLQFRTSQKFTKTTHGPSPVLTVEEENALVRWIFECARKGFPRRKQDVQNSVKEFLQLHNRPNPFKDNLPGQKWYSMFIRRHPEVAHHTPEGVTSSSCANEDDLHGWFKSIEDVLKEEGAFDVLSCPSRIFNCDETNFALCPERNTVLATTGCKYAYEGEVGQSKATLTAMCTFSADGKMCPPMVIYPFQEIPYNVMSKIPEKWSVGHSDNGLMTSTIFFEFIANAFHPYLIENDVQLPVILFVDGRKTHMTYHLSELCKELKIILIALYPNLTRILQPSNVTAFRPIKSKWKDTAHTWQSRNPEKTITTQDFAPMLQDMIDKIDIENMAENGFRAAGLYPWTSDIVDYSRCLGKKALNCNEVSRRSFEPIVQPLDYNSFVTIVGKKRINIFETISNISEEYNHNEEFFLLYDLWKAYHKIQQDRNKDLESS